MRNKFVQTSLFDVYSDVSSAFDNKDSSFLDLIDEHLDLNTLIPFEFRRAFYKRTGKKDRSRSNTLSDSSSFKSFSESIEILFFFLFASSLSPDI